MGIGKPLHLPLQTVDLIFGPNGLDTGLTYYLVLPPFGSDDPLGAPVRTNLPFTLSSLDIVPTFLLMLLATSAGIFLVESSRKARNTRPARRTSRKHASSWLFEWKRGEASGL